MHSLDLSCTHMLHINIKNADVNYYGNVTKQTVKRFSQDFAISITST